MFWKYNNTSSPQIEALLGKEDVTLQEVMDANDIINECRVQNKTLIEYLQTPSVMEELVVLTTTEPSKEVDERKRYKYANIACELLTCDVPALNERLASDEMLLDKLYSFLDTEPPLNPLLASFFSKILGALIAKKTGQNWLSYQFTCLQVLDFLKSKETFISLLLKHLGTSAIMDLMLKLFTQVEGAETKQNMLNWFDSQQIMLSLVSMFHSGIDKDRHYNVAQLLCDFIKNARENQRNSVDRSESNLLVNTLESSETIALLIDKIVSDEKCESAIIGGIQVLLALLDVNPNSISKFNSSISYNNINDEANDAEMKQKVLSNVANALLDRITGFHNLLLDPPKKEPIELTVGLLDPPVGQTRLQVLKLFSCILSSNNKELLEKIIAAGTFLVMLDLFFKYPWNNFLHGHVERCLLLTLKTYVSDEVDELGIAVCKHFVEDCKLIERLVEVWNDSEEKRKSNGVRPGYMGHVINILNEIVHTSCKTFFGNYLEKNYPETLAKLVELRDDELGFVNEMQNRPLAGIHVNDIISDTSDWGENSYRDHYINYSDYAETYSDYLYNMECEYRQALSTKGYHDIFNQGPRDKDDYMMKLTTDSKVNESIPEIMNEQQQIEAADEFERLCSRTMNTAFGSDNQDNNPDDQSNNEQDLNSPPTIDDADEQEEETSSNDSEEDIDEESAMEVDPWAWQKGSTRSDNAPDPWGGNSSDANADSWADFFVSPSFEADFSKAFANQFSTKDKEDKRTLVAGSTSAANEPKVEKTPQIDISSNGKKNTETVENKELNIEIMDTIAIETENCRIAESEQSKPVEVMKLNTDELKLSEKCGEDEKHSLKEMSEEVNKSKTQQQD